MKDVIGQALIILVALIPRQDKNDSIKAKVASLADQVHDEYKEKAWNPDLVDEMVNLGKDAIGELERFLDDSRPGVSRAVFSALSRMREYELTVPAITRRLHTHPRAIGALDRVSRNPEAAKIIRKDIKALYNIISSGPSVDAYYATRIVGRCEDDTSPSVVNQLRLRCLADSGNQYSKDCLRACKLALARLGDNDEFKEIMSELASNNHVTRYNALSKVAYIADPKLVKHVTPLLSDKMCPSTTGESAEGDLDFSIRICDAAACTLAVIAPQQFFVLPGGNDDLPLRTAKDKEIEQWKEWWEKNKDKPEYK